MTGVYVLTERKLKEFDFTPMKVTVFESWISALSYIAQSTGVEPAEVQFTFAREQGRVIHHSDGEIKYEVYETQIVPR